MTDSDAQTQRAGQRAACWGQAFSAGCFMAALAATSFLDRLTNIFLVLSTLLFFIVCRYSKRYMAGDPEQARFTLWLCLTGTCVFVLVLSQNLLVFALAWSATSLCLHQLLQFYRDRPGALLAARKKFLISRLGDLALLAALVLTQAEFGSWDFPRMFAAAMQFRSEGIENLPARVSWIAGLLVFAALLKSAQFPFHSWLPDTMDTPTPVSALMHAGIINAGGILILKLSPLISLSDAALQILCVVGSFTALFASIVMLTQASVKRCLAFSTVGQMGFMMLECGLGAFHLALLHLVAHSLYKAYAFLSSGSVVRENSLAEHRTVSLAAIVGGLLSAAGISFITAALFRLSPLDEPILAGIFTLALAQLLWNSWSTGAGLRRISVGVAAGVIFAATYFAWNRMAEWAVTPLKRSASATGLTILAVFVVVAIAQTQLQRLTRTSFGKHLYVHARNGFYMNTIANRITNAVWPVRIAKEYV